MEKFLEEYSKILDETGGHLSFQALATYLNLKEKLSSKEKRFIESHLKVCTVCKEKYKIVLEEDIELDSILGDYEITKSVAKTSRIFSITKYWKYTAAAAIVITIAALFYFSFLVPGDEILTEESIPTEQQIQSKESLTTQQSELDKPTPEQKTEEENLAVPKGYESFAANSVLENFINRNIRSEKTIEIISPEIGADVGTTITFEWKRINSSGPLLFSVVDNKNNTVYEMTVDGTSLTTDKKFKAGLYYWKLQSEGKLEAVGKYFVRK